MCFSRARTRYYWIFAIASRSAFAATGLYPFAVPALGGTLTAEVRDGTGEACSMSDRLALANAIEEALTAVTVQGIGTVTQRSHAPRMFIVSEAEAAAIRAAFEGKAGGFAG
jgi:hypothetical protein